MRCCVETPGWSWAWARGAARYTGRQMSEEEPIEAERAILMRAGSRAVTFNAPLGGARAAELCEWLAARVPERVLDLGCGRGALLRTLRALLPDADLVGVDTDSDAIRSSRHMESEAVRPIHFHCKSATEWREPADAVLCIGSSHALGGTRSMLERLRELCPRGKALVGDAVFLAEPDEWCLEAFGELPRGLGELVEHARAAGWKVEAASLSTLEEWDEFEHSWIDGARAAGTSSAATFADERAEAYKRYRGVLGFGWLQLS